MTGSERQQTVTPAFSIRSLRVDHALGQKHSLLSYRLGRGFYGPAVV
jgi:hypothetical protein